MIEQMEKAAVASCGPEQNSKSGSTLNSVEPASVQAHRDYVVGRLRSASMNMALYKNELDNIGVALKGRLISPECAVEWIEEIGASDLVFAGIGH